MRGLIEKDLRLVFTRKQTLLIFIFMALIMGFSVDGSFFVGYLTMLSTIIAVGTISYDEYDNGFAFLMTLPFGRKTYVREKYLFSFLMAAAAWCIGIVLYCIVNAFRHNLGSFTGELPMLAACIPVLYLSAAIIIPLQLKYGAEKSRIALFIIFGIIAVLIFATNRSLGVSKNPFSELTRTLDAMQPGAVLAGIAAICALAVIISYLCSIHIIQKKEF